MLRARFRRHSVREDRGGEENIMQAKKEKEKEYSVIFSTFRGRDKNKRLSNAVTQEVEGDP